MSATAAGTLAHDDGVKIMGFLLQQKSFSPGDKVPTFDDATQSRIMLLHRGGPTDEQ
jgi:hypothetical protein